MKLEYGQGGINNYDQPWNIAQDVEAAINSAPNLAGYAVVGFTVKAGQVSYNGGDSYESLISFKGSDDARVDGTYNGGSVSISGEEVANLTPIQLGGESTLSVNDILDSDDDVFGSSSSSSNGSGDGLSEGDLLGIMTYNPSSDNSDES